MSRATVVLPVPGLPVKTRWRVIVGDFSPASMRLRSTWSTAVCRWISALTSVSPTSPSSSARSSSTERTGSSSAAASVAASGFAAASVEAAGVGAASTGAVRDPVVRSNAPGAWASPVPTSKLDPVGADGSYVDDELGLALWIKRV